MYTNITPYLKKPPFFYISKDFLDAINKHSGFKYMVAGFLAVELSKNKKTIVILLDETVHAAVNYKLHDDNYYFDLQDILIHN